MQNDSLIFYKFSYLQCCIPEWKFDLLQASALIEEICTNLCSAAKLVENIDFTVVLRGDSTLRGHFPEASTISSSKNA